jgi:diguanylate cyclase (GGDEF)-like protein
MSDVLDTISLRVSFGLIAVTLLVLFYLITYRTQRSSYAGWWCLSLGLFLSGAAAYLLEGTPHQVWADPLGNALIVLGVGCVWAGSRSLRKDQRPLPWWSLVIAPVSVGLMSSLGDPANDTWSGGGFFLAAMWIQLGLAAAELRHLLRTADAPPSAAGKAYRSSVWALLVASSGVAIFYLGRWVAFLTVGPDGWLFTTFFGQQVATLITTVLLATVSFGMSTLSEEQLKESLRATAAHDGLTGLLTRTAFFDAVERECQLRRPPPANGSAAPREASLGSLILADIDHFKKLNDTHGHSAGDRIIVAFADSCRSAVRSNDLVARYGGEEFIIMLPGTSTKRACQVVSAIGREFANSSEQETQRMTASFGIAAVEPDLALTELVDRADRALYHAKTTGRDRAVVYNSKIPL